MLNAYIPFFTKRLKNAKIGWQKKIYMIHYHLSMWFFADLWILLAKNVLFNQNSQTKENGDD